MKLTVRNLVLVLASFSLVACGGGETTQTSDEIDCGPNTVEENGECVAAVECADGETATNDGRCVYSDYCGEGTRFSPGSGRCEAEDPLSCGDQTIEEDDECLVDFVVTCGEGTLIVDEACRPAEDVCGPGTDTDNQQQCRPVEDVCGENTAFDVNQRACVPISFLDCGPGTTNDNGVCLVSSIFYADLADSPDLDLDDPDASTEITLREQGERFTFVGTIDSPEIVDGEALPNHDSLSFDAETGQWLRISIYSLGLPTPGFHLFNGDESFTRLTDVGGSAEVIRDLVIPQQDSYEVVVSSLPQLRGELDYAGGEGWNYVGVIEVVQAPRARSTSFEGDIFSGDIRNLQNNFYRVEDVEVGSALALIFASLPQDAEAELQVWTDATTLDATIELGQDSFTIEAPAESFFLLFERSHASGSNTNYSATGRVGFALDGGDTFTEEIDLLAGEYVGITQYNLDGRSISAAITDGTSPLAETNSLRVSDSTTGQFVLSYYSPIDQSVTLEWENTGSDIDFFTTDYVVNEGDFQGGIDGELIEFSTNVNVPRGHRHYIELEVDVPEATAMNFRLSNDARIFLYDTEGEELAEGTRSIVHAVESGAYMLVVEAVTNMPGGFSLDIKESRIFSASETNITVSSSALASLVLTVPDSCIVQSIEAYIQTTQGLWQDELFINLIAPDGTDYFLTGPGTSTTSPTEFTFPTEDTPVDSLDGLIGESGGGDWELLFDYDWFSSATLAEMSLTVECE